MKKWKDYAPKASIQEKIKMKEVKKFYEAIESPDIVASKMKSKGKKTIGYLCSYAPEELIYAAGFHPMRLFSSKAK